MGNQYPYSNGNLPTQLNYTPSSGVKFEKGKLASNSNRLDADSSKVSNLAGRTEKISLSWLGYGLTGRECDKAHRDVRDQHSETLKVAKRVLESWREALRIADSKYRAADEDSPINQLPNVPNVSSPSMPDSQVPNYNVPKANLPDSYRPDYNVPKANLPDSYQPDYNVPKANLPDPASPDSGLPGSGMPGSGMPDPSLASPDMANPDFKSPDMANPDFKSPDMANPDLKSPDMANPDLAKPNLSDPTKTGLSGYDPSTTPSLQQPRIPEATASVDPARFTTGAPGTVTGPGTGTGLGGPGSGNQVPALAKGAANALGGMGGMPFMPMGGMGGMGGEREKDGSTSDLLRGDEEDWGIDEDVTPQVLRHQGA
ncbi:hypothetical protein [Nonomuraea cavernae]|uniref:Uncharacterized protein n=1 Tax=Nonomuraea cavernae TaxID=2045107 RepID=A0A917ZJ09_9ACTN|nr:hypothetical protein [Nonomuraea cavernae]MCA2190081.1 hypothetical protein [Nonomuraea cavernae]GGO83029.1 hypothetical protein GCM10012289_75640 [Nonomuraea cavernae]